MDKVVTSADRAVEDLGSGATLAVGGFGLCGIPAVLIDAVLRSGADRLQVVSNNAGVDDWGLGLLLNAGRVRRIVASYVGENKEFARQYLAGELEVELTPQGTLAERLRAGGSGIPAFFTATGVGTQVAEGGLPWKYDGAGGVEIASSQADPGVRRPRLRAGARRRGGLRPGPGGQGRPARQPRLRQGRPELQPLAAMAGRICVAEVEELVEPGALDPDQVHLPGVYVHRVLALSPEQAADKRIEKRMVR